MIDGVDPPYIAGERDMLLTWLQLQRDTLAWKCEGLDDEQLRRRAVPPSTLSLLGLVRHMTEVERHWFQRRLTESDAPPLYYNDAQPDGDFDNLDSASPGDVLAGWRAECTAADASIAQRADLAAVARPSRTDPRHVSLRWMLVHMIEEYARHNGHADLLRQSIDGTVGDFDPAQMSRWE
ncbi:MAG: DinB family protein [Candidatus Dormibacteria bacterium]